MIPAANASLGGYQDQITSVLQKLSDERIVARIWEGDHTVWGPEPEEIADRLGWLDSPKVMRGHLDEISALVESVRSEGYTRAVLLGMGGSSLAPEVFRKVFGVADGYLDLSILDSTDPDAVLECAEGLDLARTLFIVSTKSGGTVETFSFFKYFYNLVSAELGGDRAPEHFVAITDPESGLQDTAEKYGFRETFLNDPNIGGRYSALSHFGLVPAALIGVDLPRLLDQASEMAEACAGEGDPGDNPGAWLGVVMATLAGAGRDKLSLVAESDFEPLGVWIEQLIAESTGKDGKGILPVEGEPLGGLGSYGNDRLFAYTGAGEAPNSVAAVVKELAEAGQPLVRFGAREPYQLGCEMFRWMMATAVAGYLMNINPFDQPNVESAKTQARKMVAEYQESGELPEPEPTVEANEVSVYASENAASPEEALESFLERARSGDYAMLQAYLPPAEETTEALQGLRVRLRDRLGIATAMGYGPRFLHSTGQLHKGDGGNGMFLQITADHPRDADIPDEAGSGDSSLTFGILIDAQALGDRQALLDADRRVMRLHISGDVEKTLNRLAKEV